MIDDRFRRFCVVGLGNHARTKVIPALRANGQTIAAVVSRKVDRSSFDSPVFPTLEHAVEALPTGTTFFVATPPALHYEQSRLILAKGFDLVIEKPAFVTGHEASAAADLCRPGGAVLIEGLMHRHTRLYAEFLAVWSQSRSSVGRIEIDFLIDRLPAGTFRFEDDISSSAMFDIGCYPVSLLFDLGLGPIDLRLAEVRYHRQPERTYFRVTGSERDIDVDIRIGMSDTYENAVRLHMKDGRVLHFSPFFYGREGKRSIRTVEGGNSTVREFVDKNAFRVMLQIRRAVWQESQPGRLCQMIGVTRRLEGLAASL